MAQVVVALAALLPVLKVDTAWIATTLYVSGGCFLALYFGNMMREVLVMRVQQVLFQYDVLLPVGGVVALNLAYWGMFFTRIMTPKP